MEKFLKLDELTAPRPTGTTLGWVQIGPEGSDAPLVGYGSMPPNHWSRAHYHESDYLEVILTGTQKVGDRWLGPGDVRLVKAGTMYGPLEAGPEGCSYFVIFANGEGTNSIGEDGTSANVKPWPVVGLD